MLMGGGVKIEILISADRHPKQGAIRASQSYYIYFSPVLFSVLVFRWEVCLIYILVFRCGCCGEAFVQSRVDDSCLLLPHSIQVGLLLVPFGGGEGRKNDLQTRHVHVVGVVYLF